MEKFYSERISKCGKKQFILNGILKKDCFLSEIHLSKFIKNYEFSNCGFITVVECKNNYTYKKIKKLLDSNLNEDCFLDENSEFKFKLVG